MGPVARWRVNRACRFDAARLRRAARADERRARRFGCRVCPDTDYAQVLRRDGLRCHICGHWVARAAMSFDHVRPLARLGSHCNDNVRVSHWRCNRKKGARPLEAA